MSIPSDYGSILNDLNRDVIRHRPLDPLQFCADWFHNRLRDERKVTTSTSNGRSSLSSGPVSSASLASAANDASSSRSAPTSFPGSSDFSMPFANANPFTAPSFAVEPPSRSNSLTGSDSMEATGEANTHGFAPPSNFNMGRRTSVSAESLVPKSPINSPSAEVMSKTVIPKTDSQMQRIRSSIENNLLFRNLDEEQERDVLLAMKEVKCEANSIVIKQGDQGDFFYVVESGSLDVYIKNDPENEFGASGRGSIGSVYSTDSDGPATTHVGSAVVPGTSLSATLGEHKLTYGPSDAFGELSLLYLTPRAASIVSTSPCLLWALDRVTFRSILMETNSRKKLQLEKFLRDVHLFDTLDSTSISKMADALQFRDYKYGDRIIQQGERGTEFFIIIDGQVSVRKQRDNSTREEECGTLVTGEYFGELALLNGSARAASIVAIAPTSLSSSGKVKMAVLSEQAFKRLVGSLVSTMELHASTHYFNDPSVATASATSVQGASSNAAAGSGQVAGFAASHPDEVEESMVGPHDVTSSAAGRSAEPGMGRWVGGLGASPFGFSGTEDSSRV
ncbi:hypothetical protein CBS101457_005728 [Exobasidium rhododendri]|nr:hypothetical protein CBS101457_005728 [Exobasidium rhododendri]